jgi:hypothetical protein
MIVARGYGRGEQRGGMVAGGFIRATQQPISQLLHKASIFLRIEPAMHYLRNELPLHFTRRTRR